ncbi:sulfurtransferase [Nocardioides sp.]|uniref:sulfurtransferase n=1 Tax=Nocardioides sp. TaxID=35761 RepID=UPI00273441A3|nr:sulfurtransferase [Nocardioides sp.]MDP3890423.1 sulfurtransferase [Nocardioides sp.]
MSRTVESPLVSAADLAGSLDAVTVLDVRWRLGGPPGREEFRRGHVPGAAYVDLDIDLADPPGDGGRHPLPAPDRFVAAMRAAGVTQNRRVVVYDDWAGQAASRAWWLLRHYGHRHVQVLDGGWTAWTDHGGEVEKGDQETAAPGDFSGEPGSMPVVDGLAAPGVAVLIDARAAERYRGEIEPVDPVAGHIPGAVNVPTTANLDARGRFRAPEELRSLYEGAGAGPDTDVAVYCGSGVTATHDIMALELAGVRAALYPDGWSGWLAVAR